MYKRQVFHDDQHGTAVVVSAAMINALKLVGKRMEAVTAVINGAGAAGTAIALRLRALGVGEVILCDRAGILCEGMEGLSPAHARMAALTNRGRRTGTLADALRGADCLLYTSWGDTGAMAEARCSAIFERVIM